MSSKEEPLDSNETIRKLGKMRGFQGPSREFWPVFLGLAARYCGAHGIYILTQNAELWHPFQAWPNVQFFHEKGIEQEQLTALADSVSQGSANNNTSIQVADQGEEDTLTAAPLPSMGVAVSVAILLSNGSLSQSKRLARFELISDIPVSYQKNQEIEQIRHRATVFTDTLDLMVLLNEEDRFLAIVMTLCNELAARLQCSRVSLGWLKGRYVRVQGVSHIERFEPKMEAVQGLEAAMEESLDQDEEVVLPEPDDQPVVAISHEAYCRRFGSAYMVSLPLRIENEPVAVLSCERSHQSFTTEEVRGLRLMCDQAIRRLSDLKQQDRWFGARLAGWCRRKLAGLFGMEHTFAKCLGVLFSLLLACILFGQWTYQVDAPCILKTDSLAYLAAPYDGYVRDVNVQVGDRVEKGDPLLQLDTREFLLKESSAIADMHRFSRVAEKARADNALADMRIAEAQGDQARASLDRIQYHLARALITAPFSGVVVEGEKKDLLGAPVRKGDKLLTVARMEDYYVQLDVKEQDIHEITAADTGKIAFLSQPEKTFPIRLSRIAPIAQAKEKGSVFEVRAALKGSPASWWRPGMSGVAKIRIEKRRILWILTHRTVDFILLHLWW